MGAVGAEDSFFVAFAEDEDEVTFLGGFKGEFDGFSAIWFDKDLFFGEPRFFTAIFKLIDDF